MISTWPHPLQTCFSPGRRPGTSHVWRQLAQRSVAPAGVLTRLI
ncbi:MAG TPA: hypothetical protein VF668_13725 [Pyrinomonadaceae bacterium]